MQYLPAATVSSQTELRSCYDCCMWHRSQHQDASVSPTCRRDVNTVGHDDVMTTTQLSHVLHPTTPAAVSLREVLCYKAKHHVLSAFIEVDDSIFCKGAGESGNSAVFLDGLETLTTLPEYVQHVASFSQTRRGQGLVVEAQSAIPIFSWAVLSNLSNVTCLNIECNNHVTRLQPSSEKQQRESSGSYKQARNDMSGTWCRSFERNSKELQSHQNAITA
uniref:Uncharacterized protein n=1 Tax=Peronospora matthiolae TaxID=2874970 RepID=A0AAV1USY8_9STRA